MILVIDLTNDRLAFGATDGRRDRWLEYSPVRGSHGPLDKALRALGFSRKPPMAVVLARAAADAEAGRVSWSGVRAGVALANTLAFAWNVPVVHLKLATRLDGRDLAEAAWRAAARARKGEWAVAVYSGEPNITRSKKTL